VSATRSNGEPSQVGPPEELTDSERESYSARTVMLRGLSVLVVVTAYGCGGAPAEAQAPDAELEDQSAGVEDVEPAPKSDAGDEKSNIREAAGLKSDSAAAPAAQADDTQAVLQLAIEDTELDPYLKLGEPGRFPLKLSGSSVPSSVQLTKSSKPVELVQGAVKKEDPVLVITSLEITGSTATVSYRYDVEGIRGTAYLKKGAHGWELSRSRIVEHYKK